jgi:DNA gyrase subunit B/topoisomerase-4 subunit B
VDKHPQTKTSAMEVIFTTLHAGGKFEGQNYKTAGGLHGVGASVVNALSRELVATVRRDGATYEQKYKQGDPVGGVKKIGPARGTGTTVFFRPDPQIFPKTEFDASLIRERLEIASYLHKGVKINFENEAATGDEPRRETFQHDEGIAAYLAKLLKDRTRSRHGHAVCRRARARRERTEARSRHAVDGSTDEHLRSYVNGIPTASGGTHENGLRTGIGKAIRNFIDTHNLSPKGVTLTADDIARASSASSASSSRSRSSRADEGPARTTRKSRRSSTTSRGRRSSTG